MVCGNVYGTEQRNRTSVMESTVWKKSRVYDFAGRPIVKAAYNDRNSKFGWNVDHIYPQSRGGKTADYNLICCHIQTNNEKADRFPCFASNGIRFEIQKRQNHYEIIAKDSSASATSKEENSVNLFDAAQEIKRWNSCKNNRMKCLWLCQNSHRSVECRRIIFPQFYDFLKELFGTSMVFLINSIGNTNNEWWCSTNFTLVVSLR